MKSKVTSRSNKIVVDSFETRELLPDFVNAKPARQKRKIQMPFPP